MKTKVKVKVKVKVKTKVKARQLVLAKWERGMHVKVQPTDLCQQSKAKHKDNPTKQPSRSVSRQSSLLSRVSPWLGSALPANVGLAFVSCSA